MILYNIIIDICYHFISHSRGLLALQNKISLHVEYERNIPHIRINLQYRAAMTRQEIWKYLDKCIETAYSPL